MTRSGVVRARSELVARAIPHDRGMPYPRMTMAPCEKIWRRRLRGHVRQLRYLGDVVLLAIAYYLLGRLGLSFGSLPGNVAPVWPPAGFALGVLLVRGRRLWPGVVLGALAVNGLGGGIPLGSALGMAAGNTLAAVGAATVLGRMGF